MSLMGVVMMTGIVVSNSILIVEFTRKLRDEGMAIGDAVAMALPRASAPGADDLAGYDPRHGVDGACAGGGVASSMRRWPAPSSAG